MYWEFISRSLYHIIKNKRFYDTNKLVGKATQIFLKAGFSKLSIIQHLQACFFLGFRKDLNA